jgi:LacI family transcriptional regulator
MQQASTLKQLSEILKISVSTVSRALKNHPDISEETKKRVRELADSLEYEPNTHAIQLRNNSSNVLGIMVPLLDDFFYESFAAAVEEEAGQKGYAVIIMQSRENKDTEATNLRLLKSNRIAGVFASNTGETEDISFFLKLQDTKVPVVFFDRVPAYEACNKVCFADKSAATMAANRLIEKKPQRVLALFGHSKVSTTTKRFNAFTNTFTQKAPDTKIVHGFAVTIEEAKMKTAKALASKQRPDAIFCMSDLILMGTMQAVHESGLRVPHDIGIISISNGLIPTLYNPRITYVETSGYKLGKLAYKRMMECLGGSTFMQELTVDSVLMEGGSL